MQDTLGNVPKERPALLTTPDDVLAYVCRHGRTILNFENKFRGDKNPPLDPTGKRDAQTLAMLFKDVDISHIFCSDKVRATDTAETIAREKGIPVHKTENLRALSVGEFSGKERNKENTDALEVYLSDPDSVIPGGESLNNFKGRIDPCIMEAVDLADHEGVPVMLVAHSSVVHQVSSLLRGDHKACLVEPGGVVAIYRDKSGKLAVEQIFKPIEHVPTGRADTIS